MIAIDRNTWLVYEGTSNYGHGLSPTPLVTRATFVGTPEEWSAVPASPGLSEAKTIFREDYFDPATRIRRGRFYEWRDGAPQPDQWWVHRHPVLPGSAAGVMSTGSSRRLFLAITHSERPLGD